jgi:hypothetical protein
MAVVYPGADYRQLAGKSRTLLTPRVVNVHTMVGTMAGTESWFTPGGRPYSHFGVGGRGEVRQWQNLTYRAASDLNGNPFCISIECVDMRDPFPSWSGSNVPAFTTAQADALVRLINWLCTRFSIPKVLLTNSLPGVRGVSYHRLGIDPYRVSGGVRYSNATGKVCPGDRRIAQLGSYIMPRVRGAVTTPPQEEEDDMPTPDELIDRMAIRLQAGNDVFRRAMAELVFDEVAKFKGEQPTPAILIRGTDAGGWTGGVYVLDGARGGRWEVRGWDAVAALVAFYNVKADGEEAGHPRPWPIPVTLLDQIPIVATPKPEPETPES